MKELVRLTKKLVQLTRELVRLMRTELLKMRRTFLYGMHIGAPVLGSLIFVLYYSVSGWNEIAQISGFVEIIGIALPFAVSLVCAGNVGLEEENHFQTFLGCAVHKWNAFLAKWLTLLGMCFLTVLAAVLLFGAGFRWGIEKTGLPFADYSILAVTLCAGSAPLYLEHLFLNLRFTKSVSLSVGVAQFLLSSLFLTGLGDGRWQFFPCTWSSRGVLEVLTYMTKRELKDVLAVEMRNSLVICVLLLTVVYAIIRARFHFYEGRQCND
ncbi:MAG: lantibiotic immunity ABC transporter MutG family permease subunit [Eubacteriales bacterium]|nr:lantibiotic immunity ABC transporter MutG family permease subunit [Eubacteriales bacterium]